MEKITVSPKSEENYQFKSDCMAELKFKLAESIEPSSPLFQDVYGKLMDLKILHGRDVDSEDLLRTASLFADDYTKMQSAKFSFNPDDNSIVVNRRQGTPSNAGITSADMKNLSSATLAEMKKNQPTRYNLLMKKALPNLKEE